MWKVDLFIATVVPAAIGAAIGLKAGSIGAIIASLAVGAGCYFGYLGVQWIVKTFWVGK